MPSVEIHAFNWYTICFLQEGKSPMDIVLEWQSGAKTIIDNYKENKAQDE